MIHGFNNERDVAGLLALLDRFRSNGELEQARRQAFHNSIQGILWVEVPAGGIPARTGTLPGKPGKADGCRVFYSDIDTDLPYQLYDTDGDPLEVTVYHYGPTAIDQLYENDDQRMIMVAPQSGKLTAIVDYCQASS